MADVEPQSPPREERAPSDGLAELERQRFENDRRLEGTFQNIYEKYSQDFTNVGDEIDLETGLLIVDNGHLAHMRDERDVGHDQARRFIRDFTANLLDEQSNTGRKESIQYETSSETLSETEESGGDGSSDDGSVYVYEGDEEGLEEDNDQDGEALRNSKSLEDEIAESETENPGDSSLDELDGTPTSTTIKRKAPCDSLNDRAVRRQRFDDPSDLAESVARIARSHLNPRQRRAFDERDIQEIGQAIALQVANFVDERLGERRHPRALSPAPAHGSSLSQDDHRGPSRELHSQRNISSGTPAQNRSFQQPRPTPQRRSLWALSKPLTPAAELRGFASKNQNGQMKLFEPNKGRELSVDPSLDRNNYPAAQQDGQHHEVISEDSCDEDVLLTGHRSVTTKAPRVVGTTIKDEPENHPCTGETQHCYDHDHPQDSVEAVAAAASAAYAANTGRRLESSELFDMSTWRWTEEQDELLLQLRNDENRVWPDIAMYFPSRSYRTIQQRYYNLMRPVRRGGRLHEELERQKALNRKLMRENAAHRGVPYVEPSDDEPEHYGRVLDDDFSHKASHGQATNNQIIDTSIHENASSRTAVPGSAVPLMGLPADEACTEGPSDSLYPDPEHANAGSFLFVPPVQEGRGDQTSLHMESELQEGANSLDDLVQEPTADDARVAISNPSLQNQNNMSSMVHRPLWPVYRCMKWGPDDDKRLLELRYFQGRDWSEIAQHFPQRTFRSLQQRFYSLEKPEVYLDENRNWKVKEPDRHKETNATTGKVQEHEWTEEEDVILLHMREVEQLPWKEIEGRMPDRKERSIRQRYKDLIQDTPIVQDQLIGDTNESAFDREGSAESTVYNDARVRSWSNEELTLLRQLKQVHHLCWDKIATRFPGRTAKKIRQRYYLLRDLPRIGYGNDSFSEDGAEGGPGKPRNNEQISQQRAWDCEEEWTLHQMRDIEKRSWQEIRAHFPCRTLCAIQFRYYTVARYLGKQSRESDEISARPDGSSNQPFVVDEAFSAEADTNSLLDQILVESSAFGGKRISTQPHSRALPKRSTTSNSLDRAKSSRRRRRKSPEDPEPRLEEPWKSFPITPSAVNPRTNQFWTPTALKEPLFPPKHSTDELLRIIANGQASRTPNPTPNESSRPTALRSSPITPLAGPRQTQASNAKVITVAQTPSSLDRPIEQDVNMKPSDHVQPSAIHLQDTSATDHAPMTPGLSTETISPSVEPFEDALENAPEDALPDAPKNALEDVLQDAPEDAPEDVLEDTQEEASRYESPSQSYASSSSGPRLPYYIRDVRLQVDEPRARQYSEIVYESGSEDELAA
ncbi:MAG: hypothetical protein M1822_002342 [Bathelium mastoideum]|nr:MAG: hypothetical protein M1822_002342 [Bathelium mastoideum]